MNLNKKASILLGLILFCLSFNSTIFSQKDLTFVNYNISNGLSQSSATTVVEDNQGHLWFGTQEGLNEFDGYEFKTHQKDQTAGIQSSFIYDSEKDAFGNLWFGTKNGILVYRGDLKKFESYRPNGKDKLSVNQLVFLNSKDLLVLCSTGETYLFNPQTKTFKKHVVFNEPIASLVKCKNQRPLAISKEGRIYQLDTKGKVQRSLNIKVSGIMSAFAIGSEVFIFTKNGHFKYSRNNQKTTSVFSNLFQIYKGQITGLVFLNDKWVVATENQGLWIQEKSGKNYRIKSNIFQNQSLPSNICNFLYKDQNSVLWLGTDHGVSSFTANTSIFKKVTPSALPDQGLPCENVWSFCQTNNPQEYLIGTDLGISIWTAGKSLRHYSILNAKGTEDRTLRSVMDIAPWGRDQYLLVSYEAIHEFSPKQAPYFRTISLGKQKLINKHHRFYQVEPFGSKFLIGTNAGVLIYDPSTGLFEELEISSDKPVIASNVRKIYKGSDGRIWVLIESLGLCEIKQNMGIPYVLISTWSKVIQRLNLDHLSCMEQLGPTEFLFGTYGSGLLKLNIQTGKTTLFTKNDGLPNNVINGLAKSKDGTIWISTNRGIGQFSQGKITGFNQDEGLETNEYNSNSSYVSESGTVFFGGVFGFNYFNPNKLEKQKQNIYPLITEITFEKKPAQYPNSFLLKNQIEALSNRIELSYDRRNFTVYFQPNRLHNAQLVNYQCVIIGEETDTISLGFTNRMTFNSLASGTYYIRLYSRIGQGKWTDTPALLTVVINPPWWASFRFWGIAIVLSLVVIYFITRYRIKQVLIQQAVLEDKVNHRTEALRTQNKQIEAQNVKINDEKMKVLEQQKLLFNEKEKAEKWLRNALPDQVVKELKIRGKVNPRAYDSASILFTDVMGFNQIADSMTPTRLVNKLDVLFKKFDQISAQNQLEKIKTIGDAYMAVGGVPDENSTHAVDACLAALQIQDYMASLKFDAMANDQDYWEIRAGINTGPVTAGVIGNLKIAYDVWGASVNKAQRMEMLSAPGKVTITEFTFAIIEPYFEYEHKGKAQLKSGVDIDMYELHRIKPELSLDGKGLFPNYKFYQIVGLHFYSSIKYYKAENDIVKMLRNKLPQDLFYHSLAHTQDVVKSIERIAILEGVTDEGLFLLKTAALFHDAGFIEQYEHNEAIGARLAESMLPKYGYTEQHIKTITELIFVTQIPHKPVNHLQEIICDADLDYLGREDFESIASRLYKELKSKSKIGSEKEWDEIQIKFLKQHQYFTNTAKSTRDAMKSENILKIEQRLIDNQYS